jgi:hypothetical protein
MEESKKNEGLAKKMKYIKPELISLDKDGGAEGDTSIDCKNGSNPTGDCLTGAHVS